MLSTGNNDQDLKQTVTDHSDGTGMERLKPMTSEVKFRENRKVENFKSHSLSQRWDISFGDRKLGFESLLC